MTVTVTVAMSSLAAPASADFTFAPGAGIGDVVCQVTVPGNATAHRTFLAWQTVPPSTTPISAKPVGVYWIAPF
jgi:hypothetical protein